MMTNVLRFHVLATAVVLSTVLRIGNCATPPLLSSAALRGADKNDVLQLRAGMGEDDAQEEAILAFAEGNKMPLYQHDLVKGEFLTNENSFEKAFFASQGHGRELDIVQKSCVTNTTSIDYFEIKIELAAEVNPFGCTVADTILLGHDVNRILWDYGIGAQEEFDDVIFLAGVCPKPEFPSLEGGRALATRARLKFVYTGPGACRYCGSDNYDRRRGLAAMDWFLNEFKPQLEDALTKAIQDELVPVYERCLGLDPITVVTVTGVELPHLSQACTKNKDLTSDHIGVLDTVNFADILLNPIATTRCSKCVKLDWSTKPDGSAVKRGEYVKYEWKDAHKVRITAYPTSGTGYAPLDKARIFDTSNIGRSGDYDLGSPHQSCPGGGPGKGEGGKLGSPGANCFPVGNALIIQEQNAFHPDDNRFGGRIEFRFFDHPVMFSDIGLMDIDETDHQIIIQFWDGVSETYTYKGYGDNGVQRVIINKENVRVVTVVLPGSGAVTEINFCPVCT